MINSLIFHQNNFSMQANFLNFRPLFFNNISTFPPLFPWRFCANNLSTFQLSTLAASPGVLSLGINPSQTYSPCPLSIDDNFPANNHSFFANPNVKEEEPLKLEFELCKAEVKQEMFKREEESPESEQSISVDIQEIKSKSQIKELLIFVLNNVGRYTQAELVQKKMQYASDPVLLELFDVLVHRYSSTFKTKDEILKYITRKAFATIRNNFKQKHSLEEGNMSETLCKRYFKTSMAEIRKLGINIDHRENFLQVLFPYRKNCKNKARYKSLIEKLGCSMEFYEDYCVFLTHFEEIMKAEKERKINIYVTFLSDCIERNKIDDIKHYKRIPWLDTWMELAHIMAQEISVALKVRASNDCSSRQNKSIKRV